MSKTFTAPAAFTEEEYVAIPMTPVKSNQVAAIGYDVARKTLAVHRQVLRRAHQDAAVQEVQGPRGGLMDFTVVPIEKVKAAFARALALNPDREAAARAAAQALGITPEAVREVVSAEAQEA